MRRKVILLMKIPLISAQFILSATEGKAKYMTALKNLRPQPAHRWWPYTTSGSLTRSFCAGQPPLRFRLPAGRGPESWIQGGFAEDARYISMRSGRYHMLVWKK